MLSQKSFLETKLVERLQAAFQTSAELKAELQTKDYGTPKIHLNDIVQGYRSQNTLTIQYLMSIDTIKTLVEINLGFSIEKMILCKSLTPRYHHQEAFFIYLTCIFC